MVALFNPPTPELHSTTAWDDPQEPERDRFDLELVLGLLVAIVVIGGIMAMLILMAVRQMRP